MVDFIFWHAFGLLRFFVQAFFSVVSPFAAVTDSVVFVVGSVYGLSVSVFGADFTARLSAWFLFTVTVMFSLFGLKVLFFVVRFIFSLIKIIRGV